MDVLMPILMNSLIIGLIVLGGILQYVAGRKNSKAGFVLPVIFFLLSLLIVASYAYSDILLHQQKDSSVLMTYQYSLSEQMYNIQLPYIHAYLVLLFTSNIVTMLYLALYMVSKKTTQQNKM